MDFYVFLSYLPIRLHAGILNPSRIGHISAYKPQFQKLIKNRIFPLFIHKSVQQQQDFGTYVQETLQKGLITGALWRSISYQEAIFLSKVKHGTLQN